MKILVNVCSLLACVIMTFANKGKSEKKILLGQVLAMAFFCTSNLLVGSMTGLLINALGIGRNVLCYKSKLGAKSKWGIVVASVGIGLIANTTGLIGLFPVTANIVNTAFMKDDVKRLKLIVFITSILWGVHDFCMGVYTSAFMDAVNVALAGWFLFYTLPRQNKTVDICETAKATV